MKGREIGREAVRDILSGTAKATLLTCIFLALVGGLAIADARVLVNTMDEAARWRAGGGAIVIMNAPGRIDGAACAALRDTAGIRASGAIRPSPTSLSTPAMPSTAVTTWDVTPGFPAVVTTAPATPGETGLWLSEALAQDLNRYHGATLATTHGPAPVAGTFPMPEEDGRLPTLAYAILAPVTATGRFDACWAEVWPPDPIRSDLLRTTAHGADADASDSGLARLNPSLAADYDTGHAIRNRITRLSPPLALLLAWILGLLASRIRRLEMASSLHAGMTPRALLGVHCLQVTLWLIPTILIALPVTIWAATAGNPFPPGTVLTREWTILAAGAVGLLLGTLAAVVTTKEAHLFRYYKTR
jgi:hypothetical protein